MNRIMDIISPTLNPPAVYYPESDGQPIGETGFHVSTIFNLYQSLRYFFRQTEQVYVAADMFFYYEENNPDAVKAPDIFVAKGVSKEERHIYQLWKEKVVPCTIFEVTSKSTHKEDLATKRDLYEVLGVQNYFLFDPLGEYLEPRFQGFELVGGYYRPLSLSVEGALFSQALGLILKPEGAFLRAIDPATNQVVPTLDESVIQTRFLMERVENEARRADAQTQRAESEAQRADASDAEVARLRAQLAQFRTQSDED